VWVHVVDYLIHYDCPGMDCHSAETARLPQTFNLYGLWICIN
jgi:hypothetical protein